MNKLQILKTRSSPTKNSRLELMRSKVKSNSICLTSLDNLAIDGQTVNETSKH